MQMQIFAKGGCWVVRKGTCSRVGLKSMYVDHRSVLVSVFFFLEGRGRGK